MVCETGASGPGRELPNEHPAARPRGGVSHLALEPLRKRSDFLLAARARREGRPGFLLQARPRNDTAPPRLGLTCSRKIGNAVARNRARRRLREAARAVLPGRALPGWDYVLVGRPAATLARPFADLVRDLERALDRIHPPQTSGEQRP